MKKYSNDLPITIQKNHSFFWDTKLSKERMELISKWIGKLSKDELGLLKDLISDVEENERWNADEAQSED